MKRQPYKARVSLLAFSLIGFLYSPASTHLSAQESAIAPFIEGELLIKLDRSFSAQAQINSELGPIALSIHRWDFIGWQRILLPAGLRVLEAIPLYINIPAVISVQPNYTYNLAVVPDDASFASLYGMAKIQTPTAWDTATGSDSVVAAVIDTGVRYTHEDLGANMWRNPGEVPKNGIDDDANGFVDDVYGYDFRNDDADPLDDNGHGTHISGIIGAVGNNSLGVAGVNWNVRIMALKTHSAAGFGTTADVISACQYVTLMKNRGVNIRVTNSSWGSDAANDQAMKDAFDAMGNAGVVNVCAAGNSGANNEISPFYPASFASPSIISVASSNDTDLRSPFSNYGATGVDLAAPGSSILSTHSVSDSAYATLSGTSMAVPHVAGAVALLASAKPSLTAVALKDTILNSVDALPQWAGVVLTGGRLNVARAVQTTLPCVYTIQPADAYCAASGGAGSFNVAAMWHCGWAITGKPDWISLETQIAGSGNSAVIYTIAANTTGAARQVQMSVAGTTFTVVQDGGISDECRAAVSLDKKTYAASGGNGIITINAGPRCGWQATSNENWITFSGGSVGIGNKSLAFTVAANTQPSRRKATITINGASFSVKQKGN